MLGSAVLVHGLWGQPQDWRWVSESLLGHGVRVLTPDLPSHRLPAAGMADDLADVLAAVRTAAEPVVLAGWSYGGGVAGAAAASCESLARLVYVSSLPPPPWPPVHSMTEWVDSDPSLRRLPDGTFVLDDERWLIEGDGATLPSAVQEHLWAHRRRPASRRLEEDTARYDREARLDLKGRRPAVWLRWPTIMLLGASDLLVDGRHLEWTRAHLSDVRLLDSDHFVLWRDPDTVVNVILEGLAIPR